MQRNRYSRKFLDKLHQAQANGLRSNAKYVPTSELANNCKILTLPSSKQVLLATSDVRANRIVAEIQGEFRLANERHVIENCITPSTLFVFYYTVPGTDMEICVDSGLTNTVSKYIRRSTIPNVELRHFVRNSRMHLYVVARRHIRRYSELLIGIYNPLFDVLVYGMPDPMFVRILPERRRPSLNRRRSSMIFRRKPRQRTLPKVAQLGMLENNEDAVGSNDGNENETTENSPTSTTVSEPLVAEPSASGNMGQNGENDCQSSPFLMVEAYSGDVLSSSQTCSIPTAIETPMDEAFAGYGLSSSDVALSVEETAMVGACPDDVLNSSQTRLISKATEPPWVKKAFAGDVLSTSQIYSVPAAIETPLAEAFAGYALSSSQTRSALSMEETTMVKAFAGDVLNSSQTRKISGATEPPWVKALTGDVLNSSQTCLTSTAAQCSWVKAFAGDVLSSQTCSTPEAIEHPWVKAFAGDVVNSLQTSSTPEAMEHPDDTLNSTQACSTPVVTKPPWIKAFADDVLSSSQTRWTPEAIVHPWVKAITDDVLSSSQTRSTSVEIEQPWVKAFAGDMLNSSQSRSSPVATETSVAEVFSGDVLSSLQTCLTPTVTEKTPMIEAFGDDELSSSSIRSTPAATQLVTDGIVFANS